MDNFLPASLNRLFTRFPAVLWISLFLLVVATFAVWMIQSDKLLVVYQGF